MGSQQSKTRKLTLENDDPTSVIKVSDDVVQRLKGAEVKRRSAVQPQQYAHVPVSGVLPPPPPFYHYEPTITSLQVRQEAAEKLKKNDEYWSKRMVELERSNDKMRSIMEEEYKKAVEEMSAKNNPVVPTGEVPCVLNRRKVLECYQQYPKEPMRCAKEVQAFAACVDLRSIKVVQNRG